MGTQAQYKRKGRPRGGETHLGEKNRITQQQPLLQSTAVELEKKKKTLIQQLLIAEEEGDQQGLIKANRWT